MREQLMKIDRAKHKGSVNLSSDKKDEDERKESLGTGSNFMNENLAL